MAAEILVHPLHTLDEFRRCVQIAREVWGDSDLDTEPYVTLVIADHTGGQVLGAFDGDLMVGFTKAYVGLHGQKPYLHSHMTGVLPSHRNRRVGRYLKLFQREDALRRGIRLVEWTFDPLETKNAHFNINRLGAICRRYIPTSTALPQAHCIAACRPIASSSNGISIPSASSRPSTVSPRSLANAPLTSSSPSAPPFATPCPLVGPPSQ